MIFWREFQRRFWLVMLVWSVTKLEVALQEEDYHLEATLNEQHAWRLMAHYEAAQRWSKIGDKMAYRIKSLRRRFDNNFQLLVSTSDNASG